jgi:hypothetical protein
MNISALIGSLVVGLASTSAYAFQPSPVPEPGIFELLAIAAVAGIVVAITKPRK